MKKFNWSRFDARFFNAVLASSQTPADKRPAYPTNDTDLLALCMDDIAQFPDRYFVGRYRGEIEFVMFKNDLRVMLMAYTYCTGIKKDAAALKLVEVAVLLEELMRKPLSRGLLNAYEKVLTAVGANLGDDAFSTKFDVLRAIDLKNAQIPDVPLYPFQREAVEALGRSFLTEDKDAGLLVMPTGGGKTLLDGYI